VEVEARRRIASGRRHECGRQPEEDLGDARWLHLLVERAQIRYRYQKEARIDAVLANLVEADLLDSERVNRRRPVLRQQLFAMPPRTGPSNSEGR
jgi:hypothetical protein